MDQPSVTSLVRHIFLGVSHVLAFLFLPTSRSFQTVHTLTDNGYQASYMDHCRLQHNLRFATWSYSLMVASSLIFITTAVEIIYPELFGRPAYAATFTVNSVEDTDDGSCDDAGVDLDCTLREALSAMAPGDILGFSLADDTEIVLASALPSLTSAGITLNGEVAGGSIVTIDCNNVVAAGLTIADASVTVKNFNIENCTGSGVVVSSGSTSFYLERINALTNGADGIEVLNSDTGTVDGCTVTGNADDGLDIQNSSGLTITDNVFAQNSDEGVVLTNVDLSTVARNYPYNNAAGGLTLLTGSDNNTISSNVIGATAAGVANGNTLDGIQLASAHSNTITLNTIVDNNRNGIFLNASNSNTITANDIGIDANNAAAGIKLINAATANSIGDDGSDTLAGNTISSADAGIVYASADVDNNFHRRNTFYATGDQLIDTNGTIAQNAVAVPTITSWYGDTAIGTATPGAIVDVYGVSASPKQVLKSVSADANGDWTASDPALADQTTIRAMATVAGTGSGLLTAGFESTAIAVSNVVVTTDRTAATISWETNVASTGEVRYGSQLTVTSPTPATAHSLTVTALEPGRSYNCKVVAADADNKANTAEASCDFITAGVAALPDYATEVASLVRVRHGSGVTDVVGDGVTATTFPNNTNLRFIFSDDAGRLTDYRLHFILQEVSEQAAELVNKKKAFDEAGKAKFTVKQQQLSLAKTYAVFSGVVRNNNSYVNQDGLAKRFTFTLLDAPQLLYPHTQIVYKNPIEWVVASKAPSVTVYIDQTDGSNVMHCTAIMTDGIGSCRMPFHVPALGKYPVRLVDSRSGTTALEIVFSDLAPSDTITTDARSADFYKRIFFSGQPTLSGLVGTDHTIELSIPQIDGPMLADVTGNTWTFHLQLTTLGFGWSDIEVTERNQAGAVVNRDTYAVYRSYRPVVPAIIAPENNSASLAAPVAQLVGPDDHLFEIRNSAGDQLTLGEYVDGGRVVDFSEWHTAPGTYTDTITNFNTLGIPSRSLDFTFTIQAPVTAITTTTTTVTEEAPVAVIDTAPEPEVILTDTDNDGLIDAIEQRLNTDPTNADSDADGTTDGDAVDQTNGLDADGDGMSDTLETLLHTNPTLTDSDGDSLLDEQEIAAGTDPTKADTDDDDLTDTELAVTGTDPIDADTDNDQLFDGEDIARGCDPLQADSDSDGASDLAEALANTGCRSDDNLWSNLGGLGIYLQAQAREGFTDYPLLTHAIVAAETDLAENLTDQITTTTTFTVAPGEDTAVSDGPVQVITNTTKLSIADWLTGRSPSSVDQTAVVLSGQIQLPASVRDQPAYVLVTIFSAPVVRIAQVDPNGQWTMTVPAELLTTGEHTALAAVEVNGTRSDQVEVAKFVIQQERRLSNTSWLIIVNVFVAMIALLTAGFIHVRRKRADLAS